MKPLYAFLLIASAVSSARIVLAEEIVVRLVDVGTGAGEKSCYVGLLGGPSSNQSQQRWLTKLPKTPINGSVRFNIAEPLPNVVETYVDSFECRRCELSGVLSVGEILRNGVMGGMSGRNDRGELYCRPNLHKLEEITAKPGEIVIFVRKATFGEKFSLSH